MLDRDLLQRIVCPVCHGRLQQPADDHLQCAECGLRYPVLNGIPVLVVEQARK